MDHDLKARLLKHLGDYLRVAQSGPNGQAHATLILGLRKDLAGIADRALKSSALKSLQKIEKASQLPRQDERTTRTPLEIQALINFVEKEL